MTPVIEAMNEDRINQRSSYNGKHLQKEDDGSRYGRHLIGQIET
jgi:hypothetical protein